MYLGAFDLEMLARQKMQEQERLCNKAAMIRAGMDSGMILPERVSSKFLSALRSLVRRSHPAAGGPAEAAH